MNELAVRYEVNGQELVLTKDDVKNYLVSGNADKVTDKELKLFMELCKAQGLNPFLKEAYLIKFGNDASIITGKDVFLKRARANPDFRGFKAGIIVQNDQGFEKREGTFYLKGQENLVGGWASIYIKDWEVPFDHSVSLAEFNKGTSTWKTMPAVMIRKVALVQALREAFPDELQQLYSAEEMEGEVILQEDPQGPGNDVISDAQRRRLFAIANSEEGLVRAAMDDFGYEHTADIQKSDYDALCAKVEEALSMTGQDKDGVNEATTVTVEEVPFTE